MFSSPPAHLDPRHRVDFDPAHLPSCDGWGLPAPETEHRYERLVIEFAAAYYELNRLQALAEKARQESDAAAHRDALKHFQLASQARDALEDRCAPEGFYAEPVMTGKRYTDLLFRWVNKVDRPRPYVHPFTVEFTF